MRMPASMRMKDELTTILEAVGAAQAELAAYLTAATSSRPRDRSDCPAAQPPLRKQR